MLLQTPPLALYVHMPWCVRKCPYCDFNSHAAPEQLPQRDYIDALIQDLDYDLELVAGRPLVSIFFGGGTPSLFSPEEIDRFLESVRARFANAGHFEVTLEANPGTIEHGRFAEYRAAGITRVSLGVQSFNDEHLKVLGRIHGSADVHRAVDELVAAGLENFNLDLMYGLPQQSTEQALSDLRTAIALKPAHLSHYQLTLEPGTVFYHRPPPLPDDDATWQMQIDSQALLAGHGYQQYEVSAYAREGRRCRHNINYWEFGDYIGIGAGAHGKITHSGKIERTVRCRQPRDYLGRTPQDRITERREITGDELAFEFMLNALRLKQGFMTQQFERHTGMALHTIAPLVNRARDKGLIEADGPLLRPTDMGNRFLNDLQMIFLPE
jgi:putative oxygen-independent coproporphyrinogen III oxidase